MSEWLQANIDRVCGDMASAMDRLERCTSYCGRIGSSTTAALMLMDLAEMATDVASPEPLRRAMSAAPPTPLPGASRPQHALADFTTGALAVAESRPADAIAHLEAAVETFDDGAWVLFAAHARALLGRALAPLDRDRAVVFLTDSSLAFRAAGAAHRESAALEALEALGGKGRRARTAVEGPASLTNRERRSRRSQCKGCQPAISQRDCSSASGLSRPTWVIATPSWA